MLVWLGMASIITYVSKLVVKLLFSSPYATSTAVLVIYIWGSVFVALGVASNSYLVVEKLIKFSF